MDDFRNPEQIRQLIDTYIQKYGSPPSGMTFKEMNDKLTADIQQGALEDESNRINAETGNPELDTNKLKQSMQGRTDIYKAELPMAEDNAAVQQEIQKTQQKIQLLQQHLSELQKKTSNIGG